MSCLASHSFFVAVIAIIFTSTYGVKRNLTCFVNPGRNGVSEQELDVNIVYVIADSGKDLIHYLWSTYKVPSVIVARTPSDTELKINWNKLRRFESNAITFSNKPIESVGITISELWEMNYTKDSSEITEVNSVEGVGMELFQWTNVTENYVCSSNSASVGLESSGNSVVFSKNGTLKIQFSVAGDEVRSSEFPHLFFNGNSTEVKIVLDNLYSNFTRLRYGCEIVLSTHSSENCTSQLWQSKTSSSINDEFSPGVFSDVEVKTPCFTKTNADKAFIMWRPVAYVGEVPVVANSSDATMVTDCNPVSITAIRSIAEAYFIESGIFSAFNITFGTAGDGFYAKTEYTSWSFMIGTGSMMETGLSGVIILFLTIGLGALLLVFAGGVLFLSCRHCIKKDDDLLLSDSSIN